MYVCVLAAMAPNSILNSMFPTISKEEMQESVKKEMAILKEKLEQEKEKAVEVQIPKRPVGRPKRPIKAI